MKTILMNIKKKLGSDIFGEDKRRKSVMSVVPCPGGIRRGIR